MTVLASVDLWALAISACAILAMLRLKTSILTLGAASGAGIVLYLAGVVA